MLDWETFLTTLYVHVDDFCQNQPVEPHPGPAAALTPSETVTLAIFARWRLFPSERAFFRWAHRHLRDAFPTLPHRTQFNRQVRRHQSLIEAFALHLSDRLKASGGTFEALDRTAIPTRNVKRRGRGWLAGQADVGLSKRLGWFHGFGLLIAVHPDGIITGWGFGPGSAKDQSLAEAFFSLRHAVGQGRPPCATNPLLPGAGAVCVGSVGRPTKQVYLADKGFQGPQTHRRWQRCYGAEVIAPPQDERARHPWPAGLRRVLSGMRQIVETVIGKLEQSTNLLDDRPHTRGGFAARLAGRMALHNLCLWLNQQQGRPNLAFADLVAW